MWPVERWRSGYCICKAYVDSEPLRICVVSIRSSPSDVDASLRREPRKLVIFVVNFSYCM